MDLTETSVTHWLLMAGLVQLRPPGYTKQPRELNPQPLHFNRWLFWRQLISVHCKTDHVMTGGDDANTLHLNDAVLPS